MTDEETEHFLREYSGYTPRTDVMRPHPVSSDNNDNWTPQSLPWKVAEPQIEGQIVPFIPTPRAPLRYDPDMAVDDVPQQNGKSEPLGGARPLEFLKKRSNCNGVECSILDRERGYIKEPGDLPEELSYPALCVLTFYDIPDISNPPLPTDKEDCIIYHEEYTNSELAVINEMVNKKYGTIYRTSGKTIKKYREQSIAKPGIVPYCHQTYEGTPIGKLLEAAPMPGRAALNSLFNYFMMFFFKRYTLPHDAPTREVMTRSFMIGPRLQGVDFPKEDLAEKQFDLLVEYGIINGLKGYTNQKHLLYYATQKSGPHQIPTEPCDNTREYYICNNQS